MPILELLADVDDVDPNLADNDGNTPLIFAAQAGKNSIHCVISYRGRSTCEIIMTIRSKMPLID